LLADNGSLDENFWFKTLIGENDSSAALTDVHDVVDLAHTVRVTATANQVKKSHMIFLKEYLAQ